MGSHGKGNALYLVEGKLALVNIGVVKIDEAKSATGIAAVGHEVNEAYWVAAVNVKIARKSSSI
jgi:hypothetical protein